MPFTEATKGVYLKIEDHAMIGNLRTAALVRKDGVIDWLCLPDFDSSACLSSLIGTPANGFWKIAPVEYEKSTFRYIPDTLVLETIFYTPTGAVKMTDFMVPGSDRDEVIRLITGLSGEVKMSMDLRLRLNYGCLKPQCTYKPYSVVAAGKSDLLRLDSSIPLFDHAEKTIADWVVKAGETSFFTLSWSPLGKNSDTPIESASAALQRTIQWWKQWASRCSYHGKWKNAVMRSLITLKALTHHKTGGTVAAPSCSLPEEIGGERNWDYRFCWIRDSYFLLSALIRGGYIDEAKDWRDWLLRAVAGPPENLRVLYGLNGEKELKERTLPWLQGYKNSRPVRIGNQAVDQLQLDIYGEVISTLYLAHESGVASLKESWAFQKEILKYLETAWKLPDNGIWEIRKERRHFVHSKVMCWVAFDRAVKAVEKFGYDGPVERWKIIRQEIHKDVCQKGFHQGLGSFVQAYESDDLDASLLLIPLVRFLPHTDPRVRGTVAAIEKNLFRDGFVLRYAPQAGKVDGLSGTEGSFLACTFWLVDNYVLQGEVEKALRLFRRLLHICNEVGLLAEEFDGLKGNFLGNFPQAFSHVALIRSATLLSKALAQRAPDDTLYEQTAT
jgi:GH15 family glucan-1,4-alpha-glucosidase